MIKRIRDNKCTWRLTRKLATMFIVFSGVLTLSACVSKSTYEALQAEHQTLLQDKEALTGHNKMLKNKIETLLGEKSNLDQQLKQTSAVLSEKEQKLSATFEQLESTSEELNQRAQALASTREKLADTSEELAKREEVLSKTKQELARTTNYIKKTQQLYDDLVGELKSELAANEVKIKEMKDGINLNLSNKILFPSGSASLNKQGQQVLSKVSSKLTANKYQVMVSGFTDNVPISGSLLKRYPSNWELAGARAASVVRLLESEGIDSNLLMAVSFGENKPAGDNETAEGRSLNRRIEIRLKPVRQ